MASTSTQRVSRKRATSTPDFTYTRDLNLLKDSDEIQVKVFKGESWTNTDINIAVEDGRVVLNANTTDAVNIQTRPNVKMTIGSVSKREDSATIISELKKQLREKQRFIKCLQTNIQTICEPLNISPGKKDDNSLAHLNNLATFINEVKDVCTCAICYEIKSMVTLSCGHIFCNDCASRIVTCGVCRQSIKTKSRRLFKLRAIQQRMKEYNQEESESDTTNSGSHDVLLPSDNSDSDDSDDEFLLRSPLI